MKRIILLQILLSAGFAVAATDPNLVGWWKFDDGIGTTVLDSAGIRNGTIYGATWATGQIGGALRFDGINDYAELPNNNPVWLPRNDFTVSSWVYFDRDPICSTHDFIVDLDFTYWSDHDLNRGSALFRNVCDGKAAFQIETLTATDRLDSHDTLMKNRWYHVVGVRRGTTQEIYLDGTLNATRTCSADPVKFSSTCIDYKVNIGKFSDSCWTTGTYFLDGMIDDVRIYNRALSADEIVDLYEGTLPTLTGLEITGPNEVMEESTTSYKAIAHYDDGTTKNITTLAEWRAEPNTIAAIEAGQLTTEQVLYPTQNIKIYARYTEELITVDANLPVSVIAICPKGNALQFDGVNDYVRVPDNDSLTPSNEITIAYWLYNRSGGSGIYKLAWCSNSRAYAFDAGTNAHLLVCQTSDAIGEIISIGTVSYNQWHYLAATFNRGQASLYIDGHLDSTKMLSVTSIMNDTQPLIIGGYWEYCTPAFINSLNGRIDEVQIYNRALSAEEIVAVMYNKPAGSEPNLVAYWDFDAGAGQTVADVSGHGNNGVLGNSAGIDTTDPCWVESDIPVRCTTEEVTLRDILGAIDNKKTANQLIDDAKAMERASINLIDEITDIDKQDALKAKANIHVAIVQEDIVSRQIDATIQRLENALLLLDYVFDSNDESLPPIPLDLSHSKKPAIQSSFRSSRGAIK